MSGDIAFIDIIILAAVAAFFILKLRKVLGKRTGHEEPPPGRDALGAGPEGAGDDKVVPMRNRRLGGTGEELAADDVAEHLASVGEDAGGEDAGVPLKAALTQIKLADASFDQAGFLEGAKGAFEMVVTAFAQGDSDTLRPLLADDVYDNFTNAIKDRDRRKETLETTLVGINEAEIIEAALRQKTAFVTIKFVTEQVNVLRDKDGEPLDEEASHVTKITDIWTFARNTRSRDPNWTLVETRSPN